jgi:type IV pilus assembly protein PilM
MPWGSALALFSRRGTTVSLDIGSSHVKLLELEQDRSGKFRLKNFGVAPLPPEAIVDGAFMNTTAIVSTIKELIARQKIKTRDAVVAISGNSVIIKRISLPVMTQDELEESLPWEAEQYIPFDINDVNIDAHVLQSKADDAGQMDVLLVAARKELVNEYTSVVMEAGLRPVVIDVAAFALENMYTLNYEPETGGSVSSSSSDAIAMINVGASVVNINVLRKGVSAFTRDVGMGGRLYTEEIQRALNISYEEAEAFKIGGGDKDRAAVVPEEVERVLTGVSENIATEVHRSLDFFLSTAGGGNLQHIYLSGGAASTPGLKTAMERLCGCPVEIVDPFRKVAIDERGFQPGYLQDIAHQAGIAVGLALRSLDDNRQPQPKNDNRAFIRINLLPIRATRKLEAARRDLMIGAAGAAITLGFAFMIWGAFQIRLSAVQAETTALQRQIDAADADVKAVNEMEKIKEELKTKLTVIENLRSQKKGPVHMLDDLAVATPEKLTLTQLTQKDAAIEIKGRSISNDVISQFLRSLDATQSFEQVFLQDIEAEKEDKNSNGVPLKAFRLTAKLTSLKVAEEKAGEKGSEKAGEKGAEKPKEGAAPPPKEGKQTPGGEE